MAEPLKSAGARVERTAVRAYLRRQIRLAHATVSGAEGIGRQKALAGVLTWMLRRQERYEKRKGGLGRR